MKFSEQWLREWVDTPLNTTELTERLTLSGLEVDSIVPAAAAFTGIVVGHVLSKDKHPNADKLSCCQVDVGADQPLSIVCGAKNVAAGQKVPVATVGAILPGDFKIKKSKLRGELSEGMICSAKELGLAEQSEGILVLPADAPVGQNIRDYLTLDDQIIDIDLTPNRGDCLSIAGVAREVAALTAADLHAVTIKPVKPSCDDAFPVEVLAPEACPRYTCRILKNINLQQASPLWLTEKLRRSGIRSIDPVVDVSNYVMLELGQPMHAFDLDKLTQKLVVRMATAEEPIRLLNGEDKTLSPNTLVIADTQHPQAIAGVMGGEHSSVTEQTQSILLESAYFAADQIAGKSRLYNVFSDSSHRFERGVDFALPEKALERATALLLDIVGGEAGPVVEVSNPNALPVLTDISVRHERLSKLLGIDLSKAAVNDILTGLQLDFKKTKTGWTVLPPSHRFDLRIEEDVIEEIARAVGYDNIVPVMPSLPVTCDTSQVAIQPADLAKNHLSAMGYSETITYSFVDAAQQALFGFEGEALALTNPISADMSVMRQSLWPGLLKTLAYNVHRGAQSAKCFEVGLCFQQTAETLLQENHLAGVLYGLQAPEQWAAPSHKVDFYDAKADLESLLAAMQLSVTFTAATIPGLHPGQSAAICLQDTVIGSVGILHPSIAQKTKLSSVVLFDLNLALIPSLQPLRYQSLSKFPAVSRDIALLVNVDVHAADIVAAIQSATGEHLQSCFVFDVYEGEGIASGKKSLALRLHFQSLTGTLTDEQIQLSLDAILSALGEQFAATLRE